MVNHLMCNIGDNRGATTCNITVRRAGSQNCVTILFSAAKRLGWDRESAAPAKDRAADQLSAECGVQAREHIPPKAGQGAVGRVSPSAPRLPTNALKSSPTRRPEIVILPICCASSTPPLFRSRPRLRTATLRSRRARRDAPYPRWYECQPLAQTDVPSSHRPILWAFGETSRISSHTQTEFWMPNVSPVFHLNRPVKAETSTNNPPTTGNTSTSPR